MMPPLVVDAAALRQGAELGRGGQGQVVDVVGAAGLATNGPVVAKWYLPSIDVDPAALTRLVAWRRSVTEGVRRAVDAVACWPLAVLLRERRAAGVLLPKIADRFMLPFALPSGERVVAPRELQYLIAGPALLARRGVPDVDLTTRVLVMAELASAVATLHGLGVVLGDLSVKNILWSAVDGQPQVYLLDCDALRLTGTDPPVRQPNSPGWDDPAFPGTQNQVSDCYKLALAVLRVLCRDFRTRDPERAAAAFGSKFLPLLRAGLSTGPDARPPASAWVEPLRHRATELIEQRGRDLP